jgi:hypothetical protein
MRAQRDGRTVVPSSSTGSVDRGAAMRRTRSRRRPLRWLLVGVGPLARGSDRIEMAVRWLVVVGFLGAAPCGLVVGTAVQGQQSAVAAQQAQERRTVQAVVLAEPDLMGGTEAPSARAAVSWRAADGRQRTATTDVPLTAHVGTAVTVWVAPGGGLTDPPLDPGTVRLEAVWSGIATGAAVPLAAACLLWLVRALLDVHRLRRWTADWRSVAPLWTPEDR